MFTTDTIRGMSPEARSLLRRYGDHAHQCAWRLSVRQQVWRTDARKHPECSCGWLDVLRETCEREGK